VVRCRSASPGITAVSLLTRSRKLCGEQKLRRRWRARQARRGTQRETDRPPRHQFPVRSPRILSQVAPAARLSANRSRPLGPLRSCASDLTRAHALALLSATTLPDPSRSLTFPLSRWNHHRVSPSDGDRPGRASSRGPSATTFAFMSISIAMARPRRLEACGHPSGSVRAHPHTRAGGRRSASDSRSRRRPGCICASTPASETVDAQSQQMQLGLFGALFVPFLLGGVIISAVFGAHKPTSPGCTRSTCWGRVSGCIVAPLLLRHVGAPKAMFVIAGLSALAAPLFFSRRARKPGRSPGPARWHGESGGPAFRGSDLFDLRVIRGVTFHDVALETAGRCALGTSRSRPHVKKGPWWTMTRKSRSSGSSATSWKVHAADDAKGRRGRFRGKARAPRLANATAPVPAIAQVFLPAERKKRGAASADRTSNDEHGLGCANVPEEQRRHYAAETRPQSRSRTACEVGLVSLEDGRDDHSPE